MVVGLAMGATDRAVKLVVEVLRQDKGHALTLHKLMVELLVLDLQHSLQAAIRTHVVSYDPVMISSMKFMNCLLSSELMLPSINYYFIISCICL